MDKGLVCLEEEGLVLAVSGRSGWMLPTHVACTCPGKVGSPWTAWHFLEEAAIVFGRNSLGPWPSEPELLGLQLGLGIGVYERGLVEELGERKVLHLVVFHLAQPVVFIILPGEGGSGWPSGISVKKVQVLGNRMGDTPWWLIIIKA